MMNNSSSAYNNNGPLLKLPVEFSIFRLSLQIAIAVIGVVGNLAVIAKIIRGTNAFSVMTPYFLSLAFADLGILIVNYPTAILQIEISNKWPLGEVVCLYVVPFSETFFGASIWSITAIAAERYVKVAWRFTVPIGGRRPSKRIVLIVISIWVISFLIQGLPPYLHFQYDSGECYIDYPLSLHRTLFTTNAILMYIVPLGIIAFSYQRIGRLVMKRAVKLRDQTPNPSLDSSRSTMKKNAEAILRQTRKTQRILKPLVILFAVTMLPYQTFMLTFVYWDAFRQQSYFKILMTVMSISIATNSAADPLVYCVTNKEFRHEVKAALNLCSRGCLKTPQSRPADMARGPKTITNVTLVQAETETAV